jgi:hypothetical protein
VRELATGASGVDGSGELAGVVVEQRLQLLVESHVVLPDPVPDGEPVWLRTALCSEFLAGQTLVRHLPHISR